MKGDRRRVSRDIGYRDPAAPVEDPSLLDPKVDRRRMGVGRGETADQPGWEEGGRKVGTRRGWASVVAVVVLVVSVAAVAWVLRDTESGGDPGVLTGREGEEPFRPQVSDLNVREVAESFLGAETREERLAWARERPGLLERLPEFPAEVTALPVEFEELMLMPPERTVQGERLVRIVVRLKSGGMRLLCLVPTEHGFRADWDCFARYSTADWEELNGGTAGEEDVRVFVKGASFYLHGYADDKKWESFQLSSPDWPDRLYGYALRDSATARLLGRIAASRDPGTRMTLRVKPGAEAGRRQIEIVRVLAPSWVLGDTDVEAAVEAFRLPDGR